MTNYGKPSNGNQESSKKVDKVVKGNVKVKTGLSSIFTTHDMELIGDRIVNQVIKPKVTSLVTNTLEGIIGLFSDTATNAIHMMFYGEAAKPRNANTNADRVSYRNYYDGQTKKTDSIRKSLDCSSVTFADNRDAEAVLERMDEIISASGAVSVAQFYELCGVNEDIPYTYVNYGWKSVVHARIIPKNGSWFIKLPPYELIND